MDKATLYAKTGKGLIEARSKGSLSPQLHHLLGLIDGHTTVGDLQSALGEIPERELVTRVRQLADLGFIKEVIVSSSQTMTSSPRVDYVEEVNVPNPAVFDSTVTQGPYSNSELEKRRLEAAERKDLEEQARRRRQVGEQTWSRTSTQVSPASGIPGAAGSREHLLQAQEEATFREQANAEINARIEAERIAREDAERRARLAEETAHRLENERRKLEADRVRYEETSKRAGGVSPVGPRDDYSGMSRVGAPGLDGEVSASPLAVPGTAPSSVPHDEQAGGHRDSGGHEEDLLRLKVELAARQRESSGASGTSHPEGLADFGNLSPGGTDPDFKGQPSPEDRPGDGSWDRRPSVHADGQASPFTGPISDIGIEAMRLSEEQEMLRREELSRLVLAELELPDLDEPRNRERGPAAEVIPLIVSPRTDERVAEIDLASLTAALSDSEPSQPPSKAKAADRTPDLESDAERQRQFKLEEQARRALERAEQEAMELARLEAKAAQEARRVAAEQAARDARLAAMASQRLQAERLAQERDLQRQRLDEHKRKADLARAESERIARDEAFLKRRADRERDDRVKLTEGAVAPSGSVTRLRNLKSVLAVPLALLVLVLGLLHILPMPFLAPSVERAIATRLGEPVAIGQVRISIFPEREMRLSDLRIGRLGDVGVESVTAVMDWDVLTSDRVRIRQLRLDGVSLPTDALPRTAAWLRRTGGQGNIEARRIILKRLKLSVGGLPLSALEVEMLLGTDDSFKGGNIQFSGGTLKADLLPLGNEIGVKVSARDWLPEFGPKVLFKELTATGKINGTELNLESIQASLHGGKALGNATIDWAETWRAKGSFVLDGVDLRGLMAALTRDASASGLLELRGKFELASKSLSDLFVAPNVQASFAVRDGVLEGVDLPRALQTPVASGIRGGKTAFDVLTGSLEVSRGSYEYRNLRLEAGALAASGEVGIDPKQLVTGFVQVKLDTQATQFQGRFVLGGKLTTIVLKP
ncbi:MAG: AsmA-like C-terminal region-containing protein [Betaproteobacteria bacterium]